MTIHEFQSALHISNDELLDLKRLTDDLAKFDKELDRLAGTSIEKDLLECVALLAKLLGLPIKEVEKLIQELLGAGATGPHPMTATMVLSLIARRAEP